MKTPRHHYLLVALLAACGAPDTSQPIPAPAGVPDPLGARPVDPARTAAMLAQAKNLVRPGSVVQTESRFGVPTFLWARDAAGGNTRARWLAAAVSHPEIAASRAALASYAPLYRLDDKDVAGAQVAHVHDLGTGPILVKFRQQIGGVEVFAEELSVVMNRQLEPVALSGYLTSAATPAARAGGMAFSLAAPVGATAALAHMAKAPIDPSLMVPAGSRDGYDYYNLAPAAGIVLDDLIRTKRVYFHVPTGLEAAYYVEVAARTGAQPLDVLSADGRPLPGPEAYSYVVSAVTGQLLFRKNLIAEAAGRGGAESNAIDPGGFTYRVWADPVTGLPYDSPAGNDFDPKANPTPDGVQLPFVGTQDVTLTNLTFSQHDPWLAPGATETVGNNVDAFLNLFSPDGFGNPTTTTPSDPPTGDFRAQITGPGQFLHAQIPDGNGALAEGRQGAIQQLFYNNNFLHDWYYDAGFNEAAGNAQTNNFGRGGVQNDSIRAQAQDFSGFNNANMATGADGARPRMRMYVFPSLANNIDSSVFTGKQFMGISMSGPQTFDITGEIVGSTFAAAPACDVTNAAALDGKIARFDFDNTDATGCLFNVRIAKLTAQTNATAIMLVYTAQAPTVTPSITGFVATNTKPVVAVSWANGLLIKAGAPPVTAHLFRAPDRDGSIDQQIVFHEFFHYVSNRLVSNGGGLAAQQSGGMGEGWSDFSSMLLTVRENDSAVASNANWNGVYSLASFATSGVPFDGSANDGYYFGIRRYPYSTDMTKNPLTFQHIQAGLPLPLGPPVLFGEDGASNNEVHNVGEVWATMLWECYAGLLRDTLGATPRLTFQQAQDRMKKYIISGLKATPTFPTITEARDAVLAVAFATDLNDYVIFRKAFAKRGAGAHAIGPDRASVDLVGVTEDFSAGPELTFISATLDDSEGSCDNDGVLDHGEIGKLTFTLRNTGIVPFNAATATITTTSPDAYFPGGGSLSLPALALNGSVTSTVQVALGRNVSGIQQLDFKIEFTDPDLGSVQSKTVSFRVNTDENAASTATDTVETVASPSSNDFDATLGNVAPWQRLEVTPLSHVWHVDDFNGASDQRLVSPPLTVDSSGVLGIAFDHSWGFEFDTVNGNFDGAVIEMSVNGGAFVDIGAPIYNGTILDYPGDRNPLHGRPGFVMESVGTVHSTLTPTVAAGDVVRIRFRAGSDGAVGAAGWTIDNIAYTGVVETPFGTVVPDGDTCTKVPGSADLAITVDDHATSVQGGGTVTYAIVASNLSGDDIVGATVADAFPADLSCTWTCAASTGGACTASGTGNIVDRVTLPVTGSVTYTAVCTVAVNTVNTSLANTASVALPGPVTEIAPGNNTATDTDQLLRAPAHLFASKTVTGSFVQGGTVSYAIVVSNDGIGKQFDNPGSELVDVLPAGLTLVGASATSGTAVATVAANTVTWDGDIPAGGSVTVTITATINAAAGTLISNQASFKFDVDGDALNEATGSTDAFPCPPSDLARRSTTAKLTTQPSPARR